MSAATRHRPAAAQRGAATLVVVMLLFFVVALVAAYTSRNLIFEQRTSANQYRSTQAFEAADAGLEWALALLNAGRLDEQCAAVADPASPHLPFRLRYLAIDAASGAVGVRNRGDGQPLLPGCVLDDAGNGWRCSCPADGAPALAPPAGVGTFPAFRLRFAAVAGAPPGVVRIQVNGCTRLDDGCLYIPPPSLPPAPLDSVGRARLSMLAALKSALATPPLAALTVRGALDHSATGVNALALHNADAGVGGVALHAGTAVDVAALATVARGPAGTPNDQAIVVDTTPHLGGASADALFMTTFGMPRAMHREQPAALRLDCSAACAREAVDAAVRLNPGRVLWLDGDLALDSDGDIGSAALPALLVVDGSIDVGADARVFGLVYLAGDATLANGGSLAVTGAVVAAGDLVLAGAGTTTVAYDKAVVDRVRHTHGSFVRVPGSWMDFREP